MKSIACDSVEWEKEHGLNIIVRNNDVVYVGMGGNGFDGWEDLNEYKVLY